MVNKWKESFRQGVTIHHETLYQATQQSIISKTNVHWNSNLKLVFRFPFQFEKGIFYETTVTHKIFETNSNFQLKQRTTGKV